MKKNSGNAWRAGAVALVLLLASSAASAACTGDCSGDGEVAINEVIVGVNIALGSASIGTCAAFDGDGDGQVAISELVSAVNGALSGCAPVGPTATPTPTQALATPTPCGANDGTAAITATSAAPASGQGPLQASCVTAENAGGTRTELTRVSARGTVNGVAFLLQVYFVTASGAIDTVSYGWSPSPEFPDFFENLAFCNAPGCAGASMNLASKTITLSDTALAGGGSAVLNGTIVLDRIPDPPATPTAGPDGTPTPACPGGSATLMFSEVQGTNASQALPATLELGAAMNFTRAAEPPVYAYFSALYDGCPMPFPRLSITFNFSGFPLAAGTTYEVGSIAGNLNQIEFREDGFSNFRSWEAQSGGLVIDAIDDGHFTFRIIDARMRPRDIATTGTFVLNMGGVLAPAQ